MIKAVFLIFSLLFSIQSQASSSTSSHTPPTFSQAKKMAAQIYKDHRITFYCGCKYDKYGKIDLSSCGYTVRKNKRRAGRVEWEHIFPAAAMGQNLTCWREPICKKKNGKTYKGRKCCEKIDRKFRRMITDLHNLVPAIGEVNGDRNNFSYALLDEKPFQYGRCEMIIDSKSKKVEPPPLTRGFIARTYFYMHNTYGLPISQKQYKLFEVFDKQYPPTAWEIERNNRIAKIQSLR